MKRPVEYTVDVDPCPLMPSKSRPHCSDLLACLFVEAIEICGGQEHAAPPARESSPLSFSSISLIFSLIFPPFLKPYIQIIRSYNAHIVPKMN
jgi:hypothetical protein